MAQIPFPKPSSSDPTQRLGLTAGETEPLFQSPVYVELISKLAWALGSTYGVPYTSTRTLARTVALAIARETVRAHGYPTRGAIAP